jgi:hypothetical protein
LVGNYLLKTHGGLVEEWEENEDETFSPTDRKKIRAVIKYQDIEDVQDALVSAYCRAMEYGAEAEMWESFERAVKAFMASPTEAGTRIWSETFHDSMVYEILPYDTACEIVDAGKTWGDYVEENTGYEERSHLKFKLEQPYNGYYGFDDEACNEIISEQIHDLEPEPEPEPKPLKKPVVKKPVKKKPTKKKKVVTRSAHLAAANYKDMFKGLLALDPTYEPHVNSEIAWAKHTLKKQDRIVWWAPLVSFVGVQFDTNKIFRNLRYS